MKNSKKLSLTPKIYYFPLKVLISPKILSFKHFCRLLRVASTGWASYGDCPKLPHASIGTAPKTIAFYANHPQCLYLSCRVEGFNDFTRLELIKATQLINHRNIHF